MIGAIDANTTLISALALLQLIVSSSLVVYTVRTQRKVQAAETSIRCQERYEELLDTRDNIKNADEAERYYDRFWGAQSDQFIHWRNGLIPEETYLDWMQARRRLVRTSKTIQGIDFKSAWKKGMNIHIKGLLSVSL
ncbi:MAG: hypothetical protein HC850_10420 [Rhodomicrobium sp.]|nr:hypothetical protein [Rhodomicrobium sp.]